MRILVQPERLRQAAQELRRAQESWQAQAARLRQVFSNLDWETRQRLEVEGQVQQAVALAESLAARAGEKAAFLEAAAARFEQADSQGAQGLGRVEYIILHPEWFIPWNFSLTDLQSVLPLTRLVPLAGGGTVTGLGLFASLTWLGSTVKGLAEQIWAWLQGRPPEILSPLPAEGQPAIPKGQLARTILSALERARREQEKQVSPSAPSARVPTSPTGKDLSTTPYYKFGDRYGSGKFAGKRHPGIDLDGSEGTPVHPIGPGKVVAIREEDSGYGHYIVVEHTLKNGERVYSVYAHLQSKPDFKPGDPVSSDTEIGRIGKSGNSGGIPHLHLEIRTGSGFHPWRTYADTDSLEKYWLDPEKVVGNPDYEMQ
jgi:murein DD-endopeptidase MepM/ murein hydrolase activator NlpD